MIFEWHPSNNSRIPELPECVQHYQHQPRNSLKNLLLFLSRCWYNDTLFYPSIYRSSNFVILQKLLLIEHDCIVPKGELQPSFFDPVMYDPWIRDSFFAYLIPYEIFRASSIFISKSAASLSRATTVRGNSKGIYLQISRTFSAVVAAFKEST
jgi:hypothetical protein